MARPLDIQSIAIETISWLGVHSSIPFRRTRRCALAAGLHQKFWVSFPKPVAQRLSEGMQDFGDEDALLYALRSPSFAAVDNIAQVEDDVYLVLVATGLQALWPDYVPSPPLSDNDVPLDFARVDLAINFHHIGRNGRRASAGAHSDEAILASLASRCRLPFGQLVVTLIFRDTLVVNCLHPRPVHLAVLHNSAAAVRMILSYINRHDQRDFYLRDALQYPFERNSVEELSPLFWGILFADRPVIDVLKKAGSRLNLMDHEVSTALVEHGLVPCLCARMVQLGLTAEMLVLRQTILNCQRRRVHRTKHHWALRAATRLSAKDFLEPFLEAVRVAGEDFS